MSFMKRIAILGSTGSVGVNVLKVISQFPERFDVVGLTANTNTTRLSAQIEKFRPLVVAIGEENTARGAWGEEARRITRKRGVKLYRGLKGLIEVATAPQVDLVVVAISGSGGLIPTLEAIKAGKKIALANKESLVMAGKLIMDLARQNSLEIIPLDSEHSAVFQCLDGRDKSELNKIYLTASGGPFKDASKAKLGSVSPKEAIKHPRWKMGKKISVDSATLMNKGLEVIEASMLFDIAVDRVEVLIHPEAIIHSLVEFVDGTILAQLGTPDMRLPIQYALTYPERVKSKVTRVDLSQIKKLTFSPPDFNRFPCLGIAYQAAREGGSFPCALNAVNEECVAAFLKGRIKLSAFPEILDKVLNKHNKVAQPTLNEILETDSWARRETGKLLKS